MLLQQQSLAGHSLLDHSLLLSMNLNLNGDPGLLQGYYIKWTV
jgi:hypothetical protein